MKKLVSWSLVLILCLGLFAFAQADTLSDFSAKIQAGSPWTRYDYNCTYETRAANYLPAYFTSTMKTLKASDVMLFGDGTGAVQAIIGQMQYNVYFTEQGYLVLTSTSEGFGWTGYAIFKPSK